MNTIELTNQKYQTNGTLKDENYKGKLLFFMKKFVSFGTYRQSMYFMSTILLKYNIDGVHIPQFELG